MLSIKKNLLAKIFHTKKEEEEEEEEVNFSSFLSCQLERKIKIAKFLYLVLISSQKHKRICKLNYFDFFFSQIWLNLFLNNCHFDYITKLTK